MSKLIVKASEIENLTDARYFSAWGVDYLGFSLDSSSAAFINPIQISAIKEWLSGPSIVLEMGALADKEYINEVIEKLNPDAIQIGPLTALSDLSDIEIEIIKEEVPETISDIEDFLFSWQEWKSHVAFFVINFDKNNFSWNDIKKNSSYLNQLKDLCKNYLVVVALPFGSSDLDFIISEINPYGISLKGGAEEQVGVKSFDELDEIFEKLETCNE